MIAGGDDIHHAIDHDGRVLEGVGDAGLDDGDGRQLLDIAVIDLGERRKALIVIGAAMQQPIVLVLVGVAAAAASVTVTLAVTGCTSTVGGASCTTSGARSWRQRLSIVPMAARTKAAAESQQMPARNVSWLMITSKFLLAEFRVLQTGRGGGKLGAAGRIAVLLQDKGGHGVIFVRRQRSRDRPAAWSGRSRPAAIARSGFGPRPSGEKPGPSARARRRLPAAGHDRWRIAGEDLPPAPAWAAV